MKVPTTTVAGSGEVGWEKMNKVRGTASEGHRVSENAGKTATKVSSRALAGSEEWEWTWG